MIHDLDNIIFETTGVTLQARYVRPDGRPWATDPNPKWLWLGNWTTSRGNRAIGAINLNKVASRFGKEGIEALRRWLPEILGIIDVSGDIKSEDIDLDSFDTILLEVDSRPLKSTPTARGRYDVMRYDIPDTTINAIADFAYETPRIDRMGQVRKGKIESLSKMESLRKAEEDLDEVSREIEKYVPEVPEVPVATPEKSIKDVIKTKEEVPEVPKVPEEAPEVPPEAPEEVPEVPEAPEVPPEPEKLKEIPPEPEEIPPEKTPEQSAAEKMVKANMEISDESPIGTPELPGEPPTETKKPEVITGVPEVKPEEKKPEKELPPEEEDFEL